MSIFCHIFALLRARLPYTQIQQPGVYKLFNLVVVVAVIIISFARRSNGTDLRPFGVGAFSVRLCLEIGIRAYSVGLVVFRAGYVLHIKYCTDDDDDDRDLIRCPTDCVRLGVRRLFTRITCTLLHTHNLCIIMCRVSLERLSRKL